MDVEVSGGMTDGWQLWAGLAQGDSSSQPFGNRNLGAQVWNYMETFLKGQAEGVRTAFIGRVGLALSGGGFRASLFHIGVLARLAEMDALRHVEYLSCVSGGSIIGAYYFLEVRELLQGKNDLDIKSDDYVQIVQNIERAFLAGI